MADGLIFDIDGTLWDCTDTVAIGYNRAIAAEPGVDLEVSGANLKRLFGRPVPEIGEQLLHMCEEKQRLALWARCLAQEQAILRELRPEPYDGVRETLEELARHMPLFIVSNCHAGYAETFLEVTELGAFFSGHLCPDDNGHTKAENIALTCRDNGLQSAYYVGDTARDAQAASEADVPFIHAAYGFEEKELPAAHVIYKFDELLQLHLFWRRER